MKESLVETSRDSPFEITLFRIVMSSNISISFDSKTQKNEKWLKIEFRTRTSFIYSTKSLKLKLKFLKSWKPRLLCLSSLFEWTEC